MPDLRSGRVLLTGAAGFVGANVVRGLLECGAEIHGLLRDATNLWRLADLLPRVTLHRADVTDAHAVDRIVAEVRPDFIVHLASSGGHPRNRAEREDTLRSNVLGTTNLLEASAGHDYTRFVHVGSSLEYGQRPEPLEESQMLAPVTFRGAAKAAATLLCQEFAREQRRPVVVLRLFAVYGYWEAPTRLIPRAILAALRGEELSLTAPGYRRDFLFADDAVQACLLGLETATAPGEIINVGSGEQWSNEEVVELVQIICGRRIRVRVGEYPARPIDTTCWVADNRKAERVLGWRPRHTLRQGLEATVAWFRRHQDAYALERSPSARPARSAHGCGRT